MPPKTAGITKPIARAKVVKPVAKATTTRPATRAFVKKASVALKDEESKKAKEIEPLPKRAIFKPAVAPSTAPRLILGVPLVTSVSSRLPAAPTVRALALVKISNAVKSIVNKPITVKPNVLAMPIPKPSALQPSALPGPSLPRNTEAELESLMTIGREQVEKKLKDRIREEKEERHVLLKQQAVFQRYQEYLEALTALEDELRQLKEDNRLDLEIVEEQAEQFHLNTMKWAKLFEEYAGKLGITLFDIQRLDSSWS